MLRKLGVFGLSLLCVTSSALATSYGKIRGSVISAETGDPLIGANVVIEGTDLGAASDATGEYVIVQVLPGHYTISADMIGYAQMRVSDVIVERDHTSRIDFELRVSAIEGEVVTVVADRGFAPTPCQSRPTL